MVNSLKKSFVFQCVLDDSILNKNRNFTLFNINLTNLTQTHYFKKVCVYKGHMSDKATMQKSFKLYQAFMNYVEKR